MSGTTKAPGSHLKLKGSLRKSPQRQCRCALTYVTPRAPPSPRPLAASRAPLTALTSRSHRPLPALSLQVSHAPFCLRSPKRASVKQEPAERPRRTSAAGGPAAGTGRSRRAARATRVGPTPREAGEVRPPPSPAAVGPGCTGRAACRTLPGSALPPPLDYMANTRPARTPLFYINDTQRRGYSLVSTCICP